MQNFSSIHSKWLEMPALRSIGDLAKDVRIFKENTKIQKHKITKMWKYINIQFYMTWSEAPGLGRVDGVWWLVGEQDCYFWKFSFFESNFNEKNKSSEMQKVWFSYQFLFFEEWYGTLIVSGSFLNYIKKDYHMAWLWLTKGICSCISFKRYFSKKLNFFESKGFHQISEIIS